MNGAQLGRQVECGHGSLNSIAGICNRQRNVVGLMPHPERASEMALGSADGRVVLASVVKTLETLKPQVSSLKSLV